MDKEGVTIKSGWFQKRGGARNKSFKRRYFVLKNNGNLFYYKKENDDKAAGVIPMTHMIKIVGDDREKNDLARYSIAIITMDRIWEVQFESDEHRSSWVAAMREAAPRIPDGLLEDGFLMVKEPPRTGTWKRRYFAVFGYHAFIFRNMEDFDKWHRRMASEQFDPIGVALMGVLGAIYLKSAQVKQERNTREGYGFQVKARGPTSAPVMYEFCSNSRRERIAWMNLVYNIANDNFAALNDAQGAFSAMPSEAKEDSPYAQFKQATAESESQRGAGFSQPLSPQFDYEPDSDEEEQVPDYSRERAGTGPVNINFNQLSGGSAAMAPQGLSASLSSGGGGAPVPPPMNFGSPNGLPLGGGGPPPVPPPMKLPPADEEEEEEEEAPPPPPPPKQKKWIQAKDAKGRKYWYHPVTKETSWTNPN